MLRSFAYRLVCVEPQLRLRILLNHPHIIPLIYRGPHDWGLFKTGFTSCLQVIIIIFIMFDLKYSVFLWLCLIFNGIFDSTGPLFHANTPLKEHFAFFEV